MKRYHYSTNGLHPYSKGAWVSYDEAMAWVAAADMRAHEAIQKAEAAEARVADLKRDNGNFVAFIGPKQEGMR